MSLEEALVQEMLADADLTDHVGERIYAVRKQDVGSEMVDLHDYPSIVLTFTDLDGVYTHDGKAGLAATFVQTDTFGAGADPNTAGFEDQVLPTWKDMKSLLEGFQGTLASGTSYELRCDMIFFQNGRDDFYNEDAEQWRRRQDLKIWHEEAV